MITASGIIRRIRAMLVFNMITGIIRINRAMLVFNMITATGIRLNRALLACNMITGIIRMNKHNTLISSNNFKVASRLSNHRKYFSHTYY